ncbi:BTAD domain-containing putative transcriptional regulator [Actinomadura sp. 3N508]|uniref:AfsR/SARP family transcriptional regulator n=1 Tax=Actinomadura sp. 3N508 TaxID=3375153 RepID=UPI0037985355
MRNAAAPGEQPPADRPEPGEIAFTVLGNVRAELDGSQIPLGDQKRRLVLAILLEQPGMLVSSEVLIDRVWPEAPANPRQMLQDHITKLRGSLDAAKKGARSLLPRSESGYRVEVDRRQVDLCRFRDFVKNAKSARGHDDLTAARLYRNAMQQWGPLPDGPWTAKPFGGLRDSEWIDSTRSSLRTEYYQALTSCLELELRIGDPAALVPELQRLTARSDPPDDALAALLMRAQYLSGRQDDALNMYRRHRSRSIEEVGHEPGEALRRLHQQILTEELPLRPPSNASRDRDTPEGVHVDRAESEQESTTTQDAPASPGGFSQGADEAPQGSEAHRGIEEIGEVAAMAVAESARRALSGRVVIQAPVERKLVDRVQREFGPDTPGFRALAAVETAPDRAGAVQELRDALVARMLSHGPFLKSLRKLIDRLDKAPSQGTGTVVNANRVGKVVTFNGDVQMGDWNC